jgi:hypothetical protein
MKQTAVKWLIENIAYIPMGFEIDIIEQAKAMEKEQIEDAYDQMRCIGNYENGKQYYKKTYNNDPARTDTEVSKNL